MIAASKSTPWFGVSRTLPPRARSYTLVANPPSSVAETRTGTPRAGSSAGSHAQTPRLPEVGVYRSLFGSVAKSANEAYLNGGQESSPKQFQIHKSESQRLQQQKHSQHNSEIEDPTGQQAQYRAIPEKPSATESDVAVE